MSERTPRPDGPFFRLWSRIPRLILGGKVRTTTVLLIVVMIGAGLLYGERSEYYANLDKQESVGTMPSTTEATSGSDPSENTCRTSEVADTTTDPTPETSRADTSTTAVISTDAPGTTTSVAPVPLIPGLPAVQAPTQSPVYPTPPTVTTEPAR